MTIAEQLIRMAEDELTEYSTDARKIEKLRRKFSFAVPYPQQKAVPPSANETPWTAALSSLGSLRSHAETAMSFLHH
ncbi:hypothetical protein [Leptolyngbya sp. KIOST-1]|uniref:hypothetical protein n=1 Tax=Leptolyngbya sp. KIOST-1 TaxID=1229172 RepID=UPI00055CFB79|nr:hypothetical protein [Leptolyngbya sp. KIOST-1]